MKTDGQLYDIHHKGEHPLPPPGNECETLPSSDKPRLSSEDLLIIGIILLLLSDKCETDMPLVLALVYVLFWK